MALRSFLSLTDHQILQHLGRMKFATVDQLTYWCGVTDRTISNRLAMLRGEGFVNAQLQVRPAIWSLSFSGSQFIQTPVPAGRRQASWSVMAHACHTNQIEIAMRAQHAGFRFMDRGSLLSQGFNPAHGEHGATDELGTSYFVLLDDYAMQPTRIAHAWQRRHTPHPIYWRDLAGRAWRDVVHHFLVFTTDLLRIDMYQAFIARHQLPADVLSLKGLW